MSSIDSIKLWHAKASDEDYISKFIFEYLAFISYLMNHMPLDKEANNERHDRAVIQNLKRNEGLKSEYLRMVSEGVNFQAVPVEKEWFSDDTKNGDNDWLEIKIVENHELQCSWNEIATILNKFHHLPRGIFDKEKQKWWNCSNAKNHNCKDGNKAIIKNEKDWVNMVEFWYSLRNNLLHGITNPGDQEYARLIKNGYITLRPLVEFMLYYLELEDKL